MTYQLIETHNYSYTINTLTGRLLCFPVINYFSIVFAGIFEVSGLAGHLLGRLMKILTHNNMEKMKELVRKGGGSYYQGRSILCSSAVLPVLHPLVFTSLGVCQLPGGPRAVAGLVHCLVPCKGIRIRNLRQNLILGSRIQPLEPRIQQHSRFPYMGRQVTPTP